MKKKILEYIVVFQKEKEKGIQFGYKSFPAVLPKETLEKAITNIKEAINPPALNQSLIWFRINWLTR